METTSFISTEFAPFSLNCHILRRAKPGRIFYSGLRLDALHHQRDTHRNQHPQRLTPVRHVSIFAVSAEPVFIGVQSPRSTSPTTATGILDPQTPPEDKNRCNIPLLDIPQKILRKYADHPTCRKKGVLLPIPYNRKANNHPKEIADIRMIPKNPATHPSRLRLQKYSLNDNLKMQVKRQATT